MQLQRYSGNPVLEPTKNWWEDRSVFNAGAVLHDGRVHLLYRALGDDFISRLGYASSEDGFNFDVRPNEPALESDGNDPYERLGCEDPRVTEVDGKFYVAYTAASVYPANHKSTLGGRGAPWRVRVALASTHDFVTFDRHGIIIPDTDTKNAALFPGRIGRRYYLMHRIYPDLWLAQSDDLLHWDSHQVLISPRENYWDSAKVGAGAPPIKTELGWLEFYHGVSATGVYGLGVLLLDADDPSKVMYRSEEPILEPEREFERDGLVPNVVFTCGAVEMDGQYLVYYGGADKAIGVAYIDRDELLTHLGNHV